MTEVFYNPTENTARLQTSANMKVKVWMPPGQPTNRQMNNNPLQHNARTLSNPMTFAFVHGDVVGEKDN